MAKKIPSKDRLIVYEGDGEVLVCLPSREGKMLKEWFDDETMERDVNFYNRYIVDSFVGIGSMIDINVTRSEP